MTHLKQLSRVVLTVFTALSLSICAVAADYSFTTETPDDYYPSSSYEDLYGSRYNYGGQNLIDFQIPELEYGVFSTTQAGVMEKIRLPGLQAAVSTISNDGYGVGSGTSIISDILGPDSYPLYEQPAYTSVNGMARSDGSIGTLRIASLGINMKVWEGETNASMRKGLGHYSSTSAWDGNVGICGHNRGAKYTIGEIKDLEIGDTITYTTKYGTRTYAVSMVKTISSSDWSYLQSSVDNRLTITTCLADHPDQRICVQATEVNS